MSNIQGNIPFATAANLNAATYTDYYDRLKLLALTSFEWTGLPEMIPVRFIEETLYSYGIAAFFKDSVLGEMVSKVTTAGKLNYYGEPVKYNMYATGYNKMYDADDCVIIRNNFMKKPTMYTIQLFAQRLYEVERTLDVNIKNQKFPVVIRGTQTQIQTLLNIYAKYDGNQPVTVIDKDVDLGAFGVLDTKAPYVSDKLMLYKHDIWNEAMSFLGISNANTDKKERLITDEVQANDQLVQMGAEVMLASRKKACEAINKMYGLSVTVEQRGYQQAVDGFSEDNETETDTAGGGENG